jgi:hypothetical protein
LPSFFYSRACVPELWDDPVVFRRLTRIAAFAACLSVTAAAGAPVPANVTRFGPTDVITIPGLERHLRFIASDQLEGRDALSPGFREAARYVSDTLGRLGASPAGDNGSFLQHVGIRGTTIDGARAVVSLEGQTFRHGDDYLVLAPGRAEARVAFAASGWREGQAAAATDLKGRVLVVKPSPDLAESERPQASGDANRARADGAVGLVELASDRQVERWERLRRHESRVTRAVDRLAPPDQPAILAGPRLAAALEKSESPLFLDLPSTRTLDDTTNVVAIVPGSDPVLRHEYVALGAHLDHIGRQQPDGHAPATAATDDINNGADDDGSGVVALLEMAEALMAGPRPRRSILFVWHTGEEEGSWGAQYFTAFPTVPIGSIVAQLNVDMIGRSRAAGDDNPLDAGLTGPDEVYIVGSRRLSRALGDVCDEVDRAFLGMTLNYHYDAPDDPEGIYERSDHYEYARKGIPVAFFFTGLHADYHRPSDEVSRIDFVKLQKVARTVLATAWTLANRPERPRLDAPAPGH